MHFRFFAHSWSSHMVDEEAGRPNSCKGPNMDVCGRVGSASDVLGTKIVTNVGEEAKTIGAEYARADAVT